MFASLYEYKESAMSESQNREDEPVDGTSSREPE